jgi:hypothetical protein
MLVLKRRAPLGGSDAGAAAGATLARAAKSLPNEVVISLLIRRTEMEERDDFGDDVIEQVEFSTTQEEQPRNKRRLFCNGSKCNDRVALVLDRKQGYYVCTQCGTIANVPSRLFTGFLSPNRFPADCGVRRRDD